MTKKQFLLLDRDGTIIREKHYLSSPQDVELLPGAAAALRRLQEAGFGLVIVTNQSAVGRGYLTERTLAEIHSVLTRSLAKERVYLDGIFYCPHLPEDGCSCRKPNPAMVQTAADRLQFNPADCVVIGDKPCDIELGRRCGIKTILVRSGYGRQYESGDLNADFICDDLAAAATVLLTRS